MWLLLSFSIQRLGTWDLKPNIYLINDIYTFQAHVQAATALHGYQSHANYTYPLFHTFENPDFNPKVIKHPLAIVSEALGTYSKRRQRRGFSGFPSGGLRRSFAAVPLRLDPTSNNGSWDDDCDN